MLALIVPCYAIGATQEELAYDAFMRGEKCLDEGDAPAAILAYKHAIELAPLQAQYHYKRALANHILGNHDDALAGYNAAIRLCAMMPLPYYYRGELFRQDGEYRNAIRDFSEAIRLNPREFWAYSRRADTYRASGGVRRAAQDEAERHRLLRLRTLLAPGNREWHIGGAGPAEWPPRNLESKIVSVEKGVARIAVGSDDGVFVGHTLIAERNGKTIAMLLVTACGRDFALAKVAMSKTPRLLVGDVVRPRPQERKTGQAVPGTRTDIDTLREIRQIPSMVRLARLVIPWRNVMIDPDGGIAGRVPRPTADRPKIGPSY